MDARGLGTDSAERGARALVRRTLLVAAPSTALGDGTPAAWAAGADAVVVDLAHCVGAAERTLARTDAARALAAAVDAGADALLWTDASGAAADLAACSPQVPAAALVTAERADDVARVDAALGAWEAACGLATGSVALEIVLATPLAVRAIGALADASPRTIALALDEPSLLRGMGPRGDAGDIAAYCRGVVVTAARARGMQAHGVVEESSVAQAADAARTGRREGLLGALCRHPAVVAAVNAAFTPTVDEVEAAQRLLDAMEATVAAGRGAVAASAGAMADLANVRQAQAVLARAEAVRRRQSAHDVGGPSADGTPAGEGAPSWR